MKGIIYKWTCNVSGKSYIGQTVNEKRREKDFLTEGSYAGEKIDNARKKYGLSEDVWTKEVLKRLWCKDGKEDELRERLNFWERYYIELFDTFKNGYNSTNGGDCDFSEEVIAEMRKKGREYWDKLSEEERNKHKEYSLEYWNNLSEEERCKWYEYGKQYGKIGGLYWKGLSDENREVLIKKSKEGYNKWRSSVSDEEFYRKVVDCLRGHSIGRAIHSSKLNRGRKRSEETKRHLSEVNKGKKQIGYKVCKYSENKSELIKEYDSILEAAKSIGVKTETLSKHNNCNYKSFYWEIKKPQGVKGYSWKKRLGRWNAGIKYNGKSYDLGCFKHEEAAHEIYLIAKKKIEEGCFEDWELNHKFDEKIRLYEKYGEKMRNLI